MPSTTNFNWTTPADTDLVKDGASAIRTLGNAIDTSLVDLKGGTTGQVLSKASNTDLDFTWVADASGIPATIVDAKGDLIAATAADTVSRLAVGTDGHVLTADSTASTGIKWAAVPAPSGDNWVLIQGQSVSAVSSISFTSLTGYKKLYLTCSNFWSSTTSQQIYLRLNSDSTSAYVTGSIIKGTSSTRNQSGMNTEIISNWFGATQTGFDRNSIGIFFEGCNGGGYKPYYFAASGLGSSGGTQQSFMGNGLYKSTSNISSINISVSTGTLTSGSGDGNEFQLWGVA